MSSNVIAFGKKDDNVQEILYEAEHRLLQSVVVVGTDSEGRAHFASTSNSKMELLGALEAAKMHVWENWE